MKQNLLILLLLFSATLLKSQESYFKIEHFGVYIPNKSIMFNFPNLKKEQIKDKILRFIKEKNFVYYEINTTVFDELIIWVNQFGGKKE